MNEEYKNPNTYDFIMSPQAAPKKSVLSGGSQSQRVLIVVGGVAVLVVVAGIIITLLFGNKTNTTALISLAQTQSEITRVAVLGTQSAVQPTAKDLAASTQLSMLTDQQTMLAYIAKHGKKLGPKQLVLAKNVQTDQQLSAAASSGTFDDTFTSIMQQELTAYASALKTAYTGTNNAAQRQLLSDDYNHAELLITEAKTPAP